MYNIKFGCPWAAARCNRDKKEKEKWGCEGCLAFNKELFTKIMNSDAEEEMRRKVAIKEWDEQKVFDSVDNI